MSLKVPMQPRNLRSFPIFQVTKSGLQKINVAELVYFLMDNHFSQKQPIIFKSAVKEIFYFLDSIILEKQPAKNSLKG
jgi:hypothetical protein